MPVPLSIIRDNNGYPTTGIQTGKRFSDVAQKFSLTATDVTTVTVPVGDYEYLLAVFSFASLTVPPAVWVLPYASSVETLTLPDGTVTATLAELNPGPRFVVPGQKLQVLTGQSDVSVSISYYVLS